MTFAAQFVVALLAVLIVALSAWGIAFPGPLTRGVRLAMDKAWGMPLAVGVRVVLGIALLLAAAGSDYPAAFTVLGWITLIAALAIPAIGREPIRALLDGFMRMPRSVMRAWLAFGVLLGGFLLYGL